MFPLSRSQKVARLEGVPVLVLSLRKFESLKRVLGPLYEMIHLGSNIDADMWILPNPHLYFTAKNIGSRLVSASLFELGSSYILVTV